MKKKLIFTLLAVASAAMLLVGCAVAQGADDGSNELTIYTALSEAELPYYFRAFEEDTGIRINFVRLSSGEMMARVQAERDNPLATLMYGGPSDTFIAAQRAGLLYPYQSPELVNIPVQYHDPDGYWNAFYVGAISFANNTEWFAENNLPFPESWADLLRPELRGHITMAHPSTSGTAYTVLATIMHLYDDEEDAWAYLMALNENIRHYTRAGAAPVMEVALGEAAVAITFSHDALRPAAEGYPIHVTFPSEGTGFEVGAIALIRGGFEHEQENARKFIDWSLSVRGQELFIDSQSLRMPVNVNARFTEGLVSLDELVTVDYDAVWAGENRARLVEEFMQRVDNAENLSE